MKRLAVILLAASAITGCGRGDKVTIKGTFDDDRDGIVYLSRSDIDKNTIIDSATVRKGRFRFATEFPGPEFLQIGIDNKDFVGLLAEPGEEIVLTFGTSPLVMSYTVSGSSGSELIRGLDLQLYATKLKLDSLTKVYTTLSDEEMAERGAGLEQAYVDLVDAQRKNNIAFIVENISSMVSIHALYQRLNENTYVLYQPRDLQYLKIVSDSLSVKYPVSRHVRALRENVTSELNQMYINRMASLAAETSPSKLDPTMPDTGGKMVSLSSLRGKYVLVSFWATTSEECLAELTSLKNIYTLYHPKGLEIYQVSLDTDQNRWKTVVQYEELPWISVREQDTGTNVYSRLMNITRIPANILYDPEGNIINTNLYGRNLQIRMDQLFNR